MIGVHLGAPIAARGAACYRQHMADRGSGALDGSTTRHTGPLGSTVHVLRADAGTIAELAALDWSRSFSRVGLDPVRGLVTLMTPSRLHEDLTDIFSHAGLAAPVVHVLLPTVQTIASSYTGSPRSNRSGAKGPTSTVSVRPRRISSDRTLPTAGAIIRP